jgi:molybdopterin synthase sulfur carrier subunit
MESDERIMPRVFIPAALREIAGGQSSVELEGQTVRQLIAALDERFPGMRARLLDGDELSPSLMISIDGTINPRKLLAAVSPASEVHFLPAIGGG